MKIFLIPLLLGLVVSYSGCSSLSANLPRAKNNYSAFVKEDVPAEDFLKAVDRAVQQAGVRDTSNFAVPGFPYLRANRFLVGFKDKIKDEEEFLKWLELLYKADFEARMKEIQNLPYDDIYALAERFDIEPFRKKLLSKVEQSTYVLLEYDQAQSGFRKSLMKAVSDPTEYSTIRRAAGLYPIASLPMLVGATNAYDEFKAWHQKPFTEYEALGKIEIFSPKLPFTETPSSDEIMTIFRPSRLNALGIPELSDEELLALVYSIAPIFYQDVAEDYDRFGRVIWKDGKVTIDPEQPTVYYYATYNFIKGKPVLQLNYTIWYLARAGSNAPLIERGDLDGLTMRITLDAKGWPVITDFMSNCGCYHFFLPDRDRVESVVNKKIGIDPLVVGWQPHNFPKHRLNIKVNSGWHQIQRIRAWDKARESTPYQFIPYHILESLPHEDGRRESVFDDQGIMKNSHRIEDKIFFSSGIPKVGYMRQRGQHPTKLVGQAHFTDSDIFDLNFIFKD